MKAVTIPLKLFDGLIENTKECLLDAKRSGNKHNIKAYEEELSQCREIKKGLEG